MLVIIWNRSISSHMTCWVEQEARSPRIINAGPQVTPPTSCDQLPWQQSVTSDLTLPVTNRWRGEVRFLSTAVSRLSGTAKTRQVPSWYWISRCSSFILGNVNCTVWLTYVLTAVLFYIELRNLREVHVTRHLCLLSLQIQSWPNWKINWPKKGFHQLHLNIWIKRANILCGKALFLIKSSCTIKLRVLN